MTCLITRPEPEAELFARRVELELGLKTIVSPLMRYDYPKLSTQIDSFSGVILTSAAAVPALKTLDVSSSVPIYAVGAKTAQVAGSSGFDAIVGPGDAQGLITFLVGRGVSGPLIHLRGAHTRGDVAKTLTTQGVKTSEVIVYQQLDEQLNDTAKQALAGERPVVVPLFSPRTADIFARSAPFRAPIYVVAMSNAVAQSCAGFATAAIRVADTPDAASMLQGVKDVASQHGAG